MKLTLNTRSSRAIAALWLLLFILLPAVSSRVATAAAPEGEDAFARNKLLGRGINVLGYDPIWNSVDQARFRDRHFQVIRAGGFDSLRVNLHPFRQMGAGPEYRLSDSWWRTADWIVTHALAANLAVILDFHEYNAIGADAAGNQARFLAFWKQVAPHFRDAPSRVIFELMNEPNKTLTPELWNQYLAEALAIVRASNPTRSVVIGPAFYNSLDHLEELKLPEQDRNLIVTVHYYLPMDFTHQGAAWAGRQNKLGVVWLGTTADRATVAADFKTAQAWAQRHQRPIFLGEFGAYDKGDMACRARYTECVARTAEQLGWSWAYWQFDSDFIAYSIPGDQWVQPIHDALIPPATR